MVWPTRQSKWTRHAILGPVIAQLGQRIVHGIKRRLRPVHSRGVNLGNDLKAIVPTESVRIVFDVGAHTGQSARLFHGLFPHAEIYCFEPVRGVFRELEQTARSLARVRAFNLALGATAHEGVINTYDITQLSSMSCAAGRRGQEPVRVTTLCGFAHSHAVTTIDLLKVDVEGWEIDVLDGARYFLEKGSIPFILAEGGIDDTLGRFTPIWKLAEYLRQHGYEIYAFYDQSSWPHLMNLLYLDVLFVSPSVLESIRRTKPA